MPIQQNRTFDYLSDITVVARMATYIGTAAAVPVLRRKLPATSRTVRLPGGPAIPAAALVVCLVFLSAATTEHLIAGALARAVGVLIYAIGLRRPVSPPLSVSGTGSSPQNDDLR
jgi:amino acid transporter